MNVILFYSTALVLVTGGQGTGSDWPCWRGPAGNGVSSERIENPAALEKAGIAWRKNVGDGFSSASVADGRVFISGNRNKKDTVYCFDAVTGRELWRRSYKCSGGSYPGPRASAAVDGTSLFVLSRDGRLVCFETDSGAVQWEKDITALLKTSCQSWGFACSPLVEDRFLLIGAGRGGAALNKETGEVIWSGGEGKTAYASPVVFERKGVKRIAIFGPRTIAEVDLRTGGRIWSLPWITRHNNNAADPVIIDGKIFISSGYGRGCALIDGSGPEPRFLWENKAIRAHFIAPVFIDGFLYGFDGDIRRKAPLRCIDASTGAVMWSQKTGGPGALIGAGKRLLILNEKGLLMIVEASPSGYSKLAEKRVIEDEKCWSPPVISRGRVFCRGNKGAFVCMCLNGG